MGESVSMFGEHTMISHESLSKSLSKVPEVTLLFWIIKIAATTLGETAGDALSMSLNLGYVISTAIFAVIFAVFVGLQIKAKKYNSFFIGRLLLRRPRSEPQLPILLTEL